MRTIVNRLFLMTFAAFFSVVVFLKIAIAEELQRISNRDLYEYSLMSLKESASGLVKKNKILLQKNDRFKAEIKSLGSKLESLRAENERLSSRRKNLKGDAKSNDEVSINQEIRNHQIQIGQLNQEQSSLGNKIILHRRIKEETQKQISSVQLALVELNQKDQRLQEALGSQGFEFEKNSLAAKIEDQKKENSILSAKLNHLEEESVKPLKLLEDLKDQQAQLKKMFDHYEQGLKMVSEKEVLLKGDLGRLSKAKQLRLDELSGEISHLNTQYEELANVYSLANQKLQDRSLDLEKIAQEEKELIENLLVIRQENDTLQKEYSSLQDQTK